MNAAIQTTSDYKSSHTSHFYHFKKGCMCTIVQYDIPVLLLIKDKGVKGNKEIEVSENSNLRV